MSQFGSADSEEYEEFRHFCVHESIERNERWNAEFGGFDMPRWNYSDETLTLSFSQDGSAKVICKVITAGTVLGSRWQWSWGNQSGHEQNRSATAAVRSFGEQKNWSQLTTAFINSDEHTGWECASIACHLLNGQATYRFSYGDADEYLAYLVITETYMVDQSA